MPGDYAGGFMIEDSSDKRPGRQIIRIAAMVLLASTLTDLVKGQGSAGDAVSKSLPAAQHDRDIELPDLSGEIPEPWVGIKVPPPELKLRPKEALFHDPFSFTEPLLSESKTFKATAYALKGRTRTGVYVRRGVIAADPGVLPLGSVVQVTAGKYSGVYTVHDTGGRIKGDIVDIWVPTIKEARQFGRRRVKIQVLKLGKSRNRN